MKRRDWPGRYSAATGRGSGGLRDGGRGDIARQRDKVRERDGVRNNAAHVVQSTTRLSNCADWFMRVGIKRLIDLSGQGRSSFANVAIYRRLCVYINIYTYLQKVKKTGQLSPEIVAPSSFVYLIGVAAGEKQFFRNSTMKEFFLSTRQ